MTIGNTYVVPAGGTTITSWSTNAGPAANQVLEFKVFRLVSASTYRVVSHDGPRSLYPNALNTFPGLNIAVQPGDVIGLNNGNAMSVPNACLFSVPGETFMYSTAPGDLADGASAAFTNGSDRRVNVTAQVALATGQRAAALNKCKKKHSHKKRKKCKKKANLLPV